MITNFQALNLNSDNKGRWSKKSTKNIFLIINALFRLIWSTTSADDSNY